MRNREKTTKDEQAVKLFDKTRVRKSFLTPFVLLLFIAIFCSIVFIALDSNILFREHDNTFDFNLNTSLADYQQELPAELITVKKNIEILKAAKEGRFSFAESKLASPCIVDYDFLKFVRNSPFKPLS